MKSGSRASGLSYVILTFFKYFSKAFFKSLFTSDERICSHGRMLSAVMTCKRERQNCIQTQNQSMLTIELAKISLFAAFVSNSPATKLPSLAATSP